MKIVYCIAKTHGSGGMERVLATKANYLVQCGYEIIIITTDQQNKKSFFSLDKRIKCYDLDINYEENNGKPFLNKLVKYPFKQYKHKQCLTKILLELRADIVISMFCNDASFITDIKDGSKKILEIHFSKLKRLQYGRSGMWGVVDRYLTKLDEKIVRRFDKFVVLTHEDKGYWGDLANIIVIPNSMPFIATEVAKLTNKKVIAVGRYEYQKGFDLLIEAWRIVSKVHSDWCLDIIGEGELRESLQQQIDQYRLQKSVSLVSPTKQIEKLYPKSSLLVMSSRYEGFGMVLLEAQSFGVPVISFNCKCGPKDIISHGTNGYLVPELDIDKLASRIIEIIENQDFRKSMGQAAKENSNRFSSHLIMKSWIDLFESLRINKEEK